MLFSIKFTFRTYIYHVYICCINRIYFYIRYRYKYSTKIISLFSHQCNSFSLTFSICRFLLYFVILHFFVYREFKKNNILAHSLNIFNFSHKKEERPYFLLTFLFNNYYDAFIRSSFKLLKSVLYLIFKI